MKKVLTVTLTIVMIVFMGLSTFGFSNLDNPPKPEFTKEEKQFIARTKDTPLKVGVIPWAFPLSECPPQSEEFSGINIDILNSICKKTGLNITMQGIPTYKLTPYQSLQSGYCDLVLGAIKTPDNEQKKELIFSEGISDSTITYVGKDNVTAESLKRNIDIAAVKDFQIEEGLIKAIFPKCNLKYYDTIQETLSAVAKNEVTLCVGNKYELGYNLQKPYFSKLKIINGYEVSYDSCIMGKSGESDIIISIINKGINSISEKEYTNILMSFTTSNPYKFTINDIFYYYKYQIILTLFLTLIIGYSIVRLNSTGKMKKVLYYDIMTNALTQTGFVLKAKKRIKNNKSQMYIVEFDVNQFEIYNDFNGKEISDKLLKNIVSIGKKCIHSKELIARAYADHFLLLLQCDNLTLAKDRINELNDSYKRSFSNNEIVLTYGVYEIKNKDVPVEKMINCALYAKKRIKLYDSDCIGVYDERVHKRSINDATLISEFNKALGNNEFQAYFQPKYDAFNEDIIGSEALVRWMKSDEIIISPARFIKLFEDNGQIVKLDFHILEQVCQMQRYFIDNNIPLVPVSVNFSQVHLYSPNFINHINDVTGKYKVPHNMIEIECTETVIIKDFKFVKQIFENLKSCGYILSIDDFGSGYSSLNVLKEIPLDIIKIDREFLLYDIKKEEKSQLIIKNIINLGKELSVKTIAEGVENKDQLEFLKAMGCDYIQGFYFSKPLEKENFIKLMMSNDKTFYKKRN